MSNKKHKGEYRKLTIILWALVVLPMLGFAVFLAAISADVFGELPRFEELENPKSNLATQIHALSNGYPTLLCRAYSACVSPADSIIQNTKRPNFVLDEYREMASLNIETSWSIVQIRC